MPLDSSNDVYRNLPKVDEVLLDARITQYADAVPRPLVVDAIRETLEHVRADIADGTIHSVKRDDIIESIMRELSSRAELSLRRVINATGVIIHTNLGRSVLAERAVQAVTDVARGYSTLEYDNTTMQRGSRHDHCEKLLCMLTGAEAAIAVNNNAAAVMLVLAEFAADKEVIVSRGELVEIGGSFRIPDIMRQSHARMVEIGTTNKTHTFDYANALTPETGMLLKVHPSNYRIEGFTETVPLSELRMLADEENGRRVARDTTTSPTGISQPVLVYEDLGSGALLNLPVLEQFGEPTVEDSIKQGVDLVSFSGDKLLGGPQAGIIAGSKQLIARLKKNPLTRALRLDKMSIAALEATLRIYLEPDRALAEIPTLAMLSTPADTIRLRAQSLQAALIEALPSGFAEIAVVSEIARSGGGALPMCDIASCAVSIAFNRGNAQDCFAYLANFPRVPIVARIKEDRLLFDPRTLIGIDDHNDIVAAVGDYASCAQVDEQEAIQ